MDHESIHFFRGVDAGTTDHLEVPLIRAGKKIRDKFLPLDEAKLNTLTMFLSKHGTWLFMVAVPAKSLR
jgi:hypothetical protein